MPCPKMLHGYVIVVKEGDVRNLLRAAYYVSILMSLRHRYHD